MQIPATTSPTLWNSRSRLLRSLLGPLMILTTGCAFAESAGVDWKPSTVFVQLGAAEHGQEATVGGTWDLPWRRDFDGCVLSGYLEGAIGRWNGNGENASNVWFTQLGVTPVLRVQPRSWPRGLFAEAGIGANVIVPVYHNDTKHFSTTFNFGDHLAIGWQFGEEQRNEVALRLQHFSNAGIREPNPGENFVQLRYAHRF